MGTELAFLKPMVPWKSLGTRTLQRASDETNLLSGEHPEVLRAASPQEASNPGSGLRNPQSSGGLRVHLCCPASWS